MTSNWLIIPCLAIIAHFILISLFSSLPFLYSTLHHEISAFCVPSTVLAGFSNTIDVSPKWCRVGRGKNLRSGHWVLPDNLVRFSNILIASFFKKAIFFSFLLSFHLVPGIKPRDSDMLGMCSTAELQLSEDPFFISPRNWKQSHENYFSYSYYQD
jgi:hypothetical protein